ncbi:glutamate ABC transporter substrate-binding protein [Streptomyces sp. SRF1]|uniref:glutamate ABC transporter substrate-binding protein n=1 Tax=Streptomyces sp. SRF1 TaxID=1549642 RepID=UPI0025AFB730|nr:glutamate ABC transporter substrate-binding protein [Streptomyces sp. SRF1]MDN3059247.1 glutamate ABC transporter substrate-binding protein [Streptomyces sp. SRF1]
MRTMGGGSMRSVRSAAAVTVCVLGVATAIVAPAMVDDGGSDGGGRGGARHPRTVRTGAEAAADSCRDPEASLRPSSASGPAIKRIKNRVVNGHKLNKLIAGVDQNSYRWGYRDPATGDLTGFDIDLVRAIAEDIFGDPDAVIFRTIPTSQRIKALQQGKVDVVVRTMTINCDRIKDVAFSTAYFQAGQQVLVADDSTITGYNKTLRGKKVCTAQGSTAEAELDKPDTGAEHLGAIKVKPVPNQLDCLVRLQLGQVDAVITDNALAAGQAAQDPSVKLVGSRFTDEFYGVAMNKNDEDLVRRVNKVLEHYRQGGAGSPWMRAYQKWLAKDFGTAQENPAPPAPQYKD